MESFEAVKWDFRAASDKLKKEGKVRWGEALNHLPEPYYLVRLGGVAVVLNVVLKVLEIKVRQAGYEQLKFSIVKNAYKFTRDELMEAS